MRTLGIDYGTKRIGLAVSDETFTFARELGILSPKRFWDEINNLVEENEVQDVVVGLPTGVSGQETEKTKEVLEFIEKLKQTIPSLTVHSTDERFTSSMAHKLPGGNKNVDSLAAQIILQNYLDKIKS